MLLALALAATLQQSFDFYTYGPYKSTPQRPEAILGYKAGEDHTTYYQQELVIAELAKSDRVKRIDFGKSTEGRPLRILAITSPQNHKRLAEILKFNQLLADGKTTDIPKDTPVVIWINECIHGNESASFEAAMWTAYTLAASENKQITEVLDKAVIVLNPSYNPDGHERFVVWYDSLARGDKSDDAIEQQEQGILNGRGNHYRFDLNRDRVAMSQIETQQEVAEFRKWNPQVYVDQHGQVGTYFFPPVAQSIHKDIDRDRYIELSTILGKDTAAAFDKQGWRYFVRETFDFYGAVYLDTWSSFNGAIGLTHETDGGGALASERSDGSTVTLLDGIKKHFTSALAVIMSATANSEKFLNAFAKFKQDAIAQSANSRTRYILVDGDPRALTRFKKVLEDQGIRFVQGNEPFSQQMTSFFDGQAATVNASKGAIAIDLAQPRGHLAKAMLEKGQDFEREFTARQLKIREGLKDKEQYPGRDGIEFYDITGWSMPLAWGLDSFSLGQKPNVEQNTTFALSYKNLGGKVGWQITYTDQEDAIAIVELLQADVRVHVATKPMSVGDKPVAQGTFFVFRDRNKNDIEEKVAAILNRHKCVSTALDTSFPSEGVVGPGSDSVVPLKKPEIAIVFGDQPNGTRFGSAWFVFENVFDLTFTAITQRTLAGDLSKYTAIVLPPGARPTAQLKTWIQSGGVAIALGNTAFIGSEYVDLKQSKLKDDKDPTELPGAIFAAKFNPRSPLAFGYDPNKPIAVPVTGSLFYKVKEEGGAVVFLEDSKPLSGWTWPDEQDALKDTVWLHDQPIGAGHLVWFAEDPTDRAMWPGTYKLLLNAVLMGR